MIKIAPLGCVCVIIILAALLSIADLNTSRGCTMKAFNEPKQKR